MRSFAVGLSVIAVALLVLLPAPVAKAQGSAIQIAPTILEFTVAAGGVFEIDEVGIFNPSLNEPQRMEILVQDLEVIDEHGTYAFVSDSTTRYSISKWVSTAPVEVKLNPQEHQGLRVKVEVPPDAEPGGHYGVILANAFPESAERLGESEGVRVLAIGGVGTVLLATVPGPMSWDGEVLEFLPVPFVNLGPVQFRIRFANRGTIHYSPYGYIDIYDWFGSRVARVDIEPQRVFPEKVRQLEAEWKRVLLIGKYRAVATVFYGQNGESSGTATTEFWAFPYRPALALLAVLVALLVVAKLRRKVLESWEEGGG